MVAEITHDKPYVNQALETFINVGLVFLLVTVCFLILRPFVLLIAWGIIIAVLPIQPFKNYERLLREHGTSLRCFARCYSWRSWCFRPFSWRRAW